MSHVFGDAAGSFVIGVIADWINGDDKTLISSFNTLIYSFYSINILLIISGAAFLISAYTIPRDSLNKSIESFNKETT